MKTVEHILKGHNGKVVDVPAKYDEKAKGLIKDVLELKKAKDIPLLENKYEYMHNPQIFKSVKELYEYNTSYTPGDPLSKQKLQELKDNVYLAVCSYGANRMNTKKLKKARKKSKDGRLKLNNKNSKIMERIEKILRDD